MLSVTKSWSLKDAVAASLGVDEMVAQTASGASGELLWTASVSVLVKQGGALSVQASPRPHDGIACMRGADGKVETARHVGRGPRARGTESKGHADIAAGEKRTERSNASLSGLCRNTERECVLKP